MITYYDVVEDVRYLKARGCETGSIGKSYFKRDIPFVAMGEGETVLVTAGIHAREHVSTLFAVRQMYAALNVPLPCKLVFVPLVNPDGNVLVKYGADALPNGEKLKEINGSGDFALWKANGRGVDLNVNFDALWGSGEQNVFFPASANFVGAYPFSEPETTALAAFTKELRPVLTLSYHAKGREIYYEFHQKGEALARDRALADIACAYTGYRRIDGTRGSAGGYKDWCIFALKIPSFTVELCSDSYAHPLPDEAIQEDFAKSPLLPIVLYNGLKRMRTA